MKKILTMALLFVLAFSPYAWALTKESNQILDQGSRLFESTLFKVTVLFGLLIILFLVLYVLKKVWEKERKESSVGFNPEQRSKNY